MRLCSWFPPITCRGVVAVAVTVLLAASACSGASSASGGSGASSAASRPDAEERARSQALARHRARQEAACERVSVVITDCAVADAKATLPPEKLAELDLENTAPRHRAKFTASCMDSDMSPRQVQVFEDCLAGDTTCAVFLDCLDRAKPQPSGTTRRSE